MLSAIEHERFIRVFE